MSEGLEKDLEALLPSRWKSRWQRLSNRAKIAYKVGIAVAAVVGVLSGAYDYIEPSLDISPGVIGSNIDPLAAEFVIKNTGHLSLVDNVITCDVQAANGHFIFNRNVVVSPGRRMAQLIPELSPGATVTRNCGQLAVMPRRPIFPATIVITILSHWPKLWPVLPWYSEDRFVSILDSSGHMQIVPDDSE